MPSKKKNLMKKTKTNFFYGGAGKINLGSMQPIIKSLLIKNRNLSYYLEYINFKLIKENESSSDDKIKASDVESVLQTFSVAINVIEAKSEEIRNNPPPKQEPQQDVVNYDSEDEDLYDDFDCHEGQFCVLPEEREETTRLVFNEIKELLEKINNE